MGAPSGRWVFIGVKKSVQKFYQKLGVYSKVGAFIREANLKERGGRKTIKERSSSGAGVVGRKTARRNSRKQAPLEKQGSHIDFPKND